MIAKAQSGQVNDISLGSGNIIQLNPGEKWDMAESKVPATDFEKFVESELTHIASGVGNGGLAYEMVLQKYNDNYSASRATIAGQEKKFKNLRSVFSTQFCDPIWEQVIDWGIRKGYIEAPGYIDGDWMFRKSVLACTWIGPSPINIDPKKEVEAHIMAINAGLETKEDAVREMFGKDYEETVERRVHEQELERSSGLEDSAEETNTQPSEQEENSNE
jgi:capsid protein